MLKKLVFILCVVLFWQCIAAPGARAQNANPCVVTALWYFPDPVPFGWYFYGPGQGPYSYVIATQTTGCHPPCNCPGSAGTAQSPVSLASGDTYIKQVDVTLPGLGGGLSLTRTWNSVWPPLLAVYSNGMFGPYWRSTYEEQIVTPADHYIRYLRGDGTAWVFGGSGSGQFQVAAPANIPATLFAGTSNLVLTFQNGEQRQFNRSSGLLTSIIDRNGNTTQLTYDNSNRLVTVTSPASQHLYFNYQSGSSLLVTSVTSDFGVTYSYSYDAQGRLSQVTKPDQTTVSFTYNTQSQITQVTDSNGKVLESHTYDSNRRGLTASQANGVNAVTLTYP
jgi:YD repeat-containing protein